MTAPSSSSTTTIPLDSDSSSRRFFGAGFDWISFALIVFLSLWGILTLNSATQIRSDEVVAGKIPEAFKQIAFVVVGLAAMIGLALSNYRWLMHLQTWIYVLNICSLLLVLVLPLSIAPKINGAKSWIVLGPVSLQVAEFSKFALLLCLSAFITRRQREITSPKTILLSFIYLLPPLVLILLQPDFGTAMATLSIWFGVLFFGGARLKHLLFVLVLGLSLFTGAYATGKLKPHQVGRLVSFFQPEMASRAEKYQLEQSLVAIGGGKLSGQGYFNGMQNRARYVPENETDFIFTVVAEELGFLGGALLICCFGLLLLRTATQALNTDNYFGILLCGGFTALLGFHCIVNLGMTMRVMPITGVPLPFFSKGGSSFLAFSMCAGLLQSISLHRR
jgi:rod shape determining protein RodA